jgi:hypothetical protein
MADFNRYRIYCETESAWVEDHADVEPTTCPNNPAHTVRAGSAAELDSKRIILVPDADGQGILGGETGVGDEMERVIGATRIEKSTNQSVPALMLQCSTGHPTGYGCLQLDMDVDGAALDIDSEATAYPLINLDAVLANTRGDIAFGTARTADPSTPSEGDLWYQSTAGEFKFRKSASTVEVRDAIKLQTYPIATTAPLGDYVLAWNATASEWQPTSMANLPGPYSDSASSTTSTTTTSATYELMAGMTITPPAGKYFVSFSTTFEHSNNGETIQYTIYAAGSQIVASERTVTSPRWVNADYPAMTGAIVTVNGSQAIGVGWRTTSPTATALTRSLFIVRVS